MTRSGLWTCVALLAACGGNSTGDDDGGGSATAVRFTQSVGGAMWVNPDVFPTIPVHVVVDGEPTKVTVAVDGVAFDAVKDGDTWTAQVDVAALADGDHQLVVDSHGVTADATLAVGHQGIQWTSIGTDGNAATPRLHRIGEHVYLTWTSFDELGPNGRRVVWLQEIDGAGRTLADKVALLGGAGQEDKLYARTAFGTTSINVSPPATINVSPPATINVSPPATINVSPPATIGVLYQERGGPYKNFFTVVGPDGKSIVAPIALDPSERSGSFSGDVVFDGTGYDLVWRTNQGAGSSDVRWMHVDEATGTVTGPVIAAAPGNGNPDGGFDAITNVTIGHAGATSLIAFSRYVHDTQLDSDLLRCQLATVTDGVATTALVGIGQPWVWDDDCRILDDGTGPVAVRSTKSLTSNEDNPPDQMFATHAPLSSDRGDGLMIVTAPETRVEPTMIGTSASTILAWSDSRSYAADISTGEVELYAAVLGADLIAGDNLRFAHSHFIEGSADIRGVSAGENALLTWIDERHGGTVVNPIPEVYLETVWQ